MENIFIYTRGFKFSFPIFPNKN